MDERVIQVATALAGALCFAIIFSTPRRYLVPTIAIGATAPIAMHAVPPAWHVGFATFIVALGISCVSHLLARITRAPAQCFLIPGVIFLVPGTYVYRAFSAALDKNFPLATELAIASVMITLGVSLGLLIANWIVPTRKSL